MEELKNRFYEKMCQLQETITAELQRVDSDLKLTEDLWKREDFRQEPGGGGRTRAFEGQIIENAGVNTSQVFGAIDPQFAEQLKTGSNELWASGISLIIHPRNPRVPTVHANFRMIQSGEKLWFGGGADLTPYYPYEEDFQYFHGIWREALGNKYSSYKKNCDEYFVNHHRDGEMRGIGGFFYDHWYADNIEKAQDQVFSWASKFIPSYFPLVDKRKQEEWTQEDEAFQLYRRGRYVEFNLLHDRGTLFGLKTKGRIPSILISLPARCSFSYTYKPKAGSPHEKMMEYYRPYDWCS